MEGTEEATAEGAPQAKFTAVDYTLFILMLVASIGIGIVSAVKSRGKASTQEYLLGGRNMAAAPVVLSLLGGWISAVSVLGNPTEIYFFGTQLTTILLGSVLGCVFVGQVILPIFYQLKLVSINEYIELRFGSRLLRKMSTVCLLLTLVAYMGVGMYAPALTLSAVIPMPTWASSLIMGTICTFYITIGGVKAVVYTDVLQTLVMFGGVLAVVVVCCVDLGGVANVWSIADQGGRLTFFDLNPSPFERHTFWSTVVFGFYQIVISVGFNQHTYQRFASVSTLQTSKRLLIGFLVGLYMLWTVTYFAGLVAYATYSDCDPLTSGKIQKPDQIITFLVTDKLSHMNGLAGIFVAAVYGAVLSTLSSCGNSMACMVWEDFLKDIPYFAGISDAKATNVLKLLSAASGVVAVSMSLLVETLGNIFIVSNTLTSAVGGPYCGLFLAGMCAPWVNAKGAIVGMTASLIFSLWVAIGKFIRGGGMPSRLPLSIEGCQESLHLLVNTTVTSFLTNTSLTDALPTNFTNTHTTLDVVTMSDAPPSNITYANSLEFNTIYEISYCYMGMIAVIITIVVASLVSICTGVISPGAKDKGLVNPACARLYHWASNVHTGSQQDQKITRTELSHVESSSS